MKALGAILVCSWLAACAAQPLFVTYSAPQGMNAGVPADAIPYFLPRKLVAVTVQRTRTPRDTVSVRVLAPVADPAEIYYLRFRRSAWRDTKASVRTGASGLLSSIGVSSKDESSAVLADAVSLAALLPEVSATAAVLGGEGLESLAGFAAGTRPAPESRVECGTLANGLASAPSSASGPAFKATVVFDPADPADLARAEHELCSRGAHYRFVTIPIGAPPASGAAAVPDTPEASASPSVRPASPSPAVSAGVYYRRDQPFVLAIYDGGGEGAGVGEGGGGGEGGAVSDREAPRGASGAARAAGFMLVSAALIQIPNLAPRQLLALSASAGVATHASATFADGMLLSASVDAPSTARAVASLPLDLARAIVSIPSALFQFRIDSTRDAARLTEARTEAIKAEIALLKAREAPH